MKNPPPERPYVLARAGKQRQDVCEAIGLTLGDVRIVHHADNLSGAFNGTLYVYKGHSPLSTAFSKIIASAKARGFTINTINPHTQREES